MGAKLIRKFVGVFAGALILSSTMFVASAGAAGTKNYVYSGTTGGDSSTCGPDWATDTDTRTFKVQKLQNVNGSYRVTETFTKATFVTDAGPSPESCEAGDANAVIAGVTGKFRGSEVLDVTGGTFTAPKTIDCGGTACTTASFVAAAFGVSAAYSVPDYSFEYTIAKNAGCATDWVDAATGDAGDIATTCAPSPGL